MTIIGVTLPSLQRHNGKLKIAKHLLSCKVKITCTSLLQEFISSICGNCPKQRSWAKTMCGIMAFQIESLISVLLSMIAMWLCSKSMQINYVWKRGTQVICVQIKLPSKGHPRCVMSGLATVWRVNFVCVGSDVVVVYGCAIPAGVAETPYGHLKSVNITRRFAPSWHELRKTDHLGLSSFFHCTH